MSETSTLISNSAVSGAYRSSRDMQVNLPAPELPVQERTSSFADMIKDAGAEAVQTIRQAEQVTQAGMRGDIETQTVVEATLELDTTVKVAVTVRDKLVEAYQEIMRMPI
ncbi:flagellar biosynthesis protein [Oceanicola sp. 22II-s10i]|uniref:flagellar hook-basal body complex protein FliE n=1 Tax=Oceanicola sp. 22II-s10i TaxID=1317116 RepID=UPI000B52459A|nr:flagellar hook-basal body complex protein FliE [Oceanicola sp. 22II-s10i]OWU83168.1 flagellar biosynthesis protein [Oceanicola sp. 22II-s10i]